MKQIIVYDLLVTIALVVGYARGYTEGKRKYVTKIQNLIKKYESFIK